LTQPLPCAPGRHRDRRVRLDPVDQARIDAFADVTEDPAVHPRRSGAAAAKTPFGGTIAHGFLTLSLLSRMAADACSPRQA
jgi:acyl dehydratase